MAEWAERPWRAGPFREQEGVGWEGGICEGGIMAFASEMWIFCLLPTSLIYQHLEGKVISTFLWYRSSYVAFSIWNFESLLREQVLFVRLFVFNNTSFIEM